MLSITPLKSKDPSGGAGSIPDYLRATEYYIGRDGQEHSASAWCGAGARALGLTGAVTETVMNHLAAGFSPDGKTALRQNAGEKPEERQIKDRAGNVRKDEHGKELTAIHGVRIGFDLTFSAVKSVSVAMAHADPDLRQEIIDAHHVAVEKALTFLEQHAAETRRGKAGRDVYGAELVISRHTHFGARPHEKEWKQKGDHDLDVDPQLHTHSVLWNLGRAPDGTWGSLEPREIYRWKKAAGALYRAELAHQMQRLGFNIKEDIRYDKDGQVKDRFWKLAGIPDALAEQMSGRRKEILAYQAEHGGTAQQATLKTRRNKDEPTFAEMHARWQDDLAQWRREHPGQLPENIRDLCHRGRRTPSEQQTQEQRDHALLAELHENKSVWTRADLVQKLAERSTHMSATQVWREAGAFLKRNELQLIEPEKIHKDDRGKSLSRRHTEIRFADPKVVKQEQDIVAMATERLHDRRVQLDPRVVKKAIKEMEQERGFQLSAEQRKAAEFICCGSGGIAVAQGWAGTGKTTVSDAVVKAYRESGFTVMGCATAWKAAKKLEGESGVTSYSIAQMVDQLDKGKMQLTSKSVVLVDEAGMMGTPSLHALIGHAHKAGAKLIAQGDVLQLQSVERGAPMRALAAAIGYTELKDIRRQKQEKDRATARSFYEAGGTEQRSRSQNEVAGQKTLQRMEANGQIQAYDTRDQSREYLVKDYLASPKPYREKLALAATRGDVDLLNGAIRDGRKAKGELGLDHTVGVSNPRTQQRQDLVLASGDRVMFTKKSKELGVVNGTTLIVTAVVPDGKGGHSIEGVIESDIKKEDGRKLAFRAMDVSLMHSYASTVHKSQGQSVSEVFHLGHRGMTDRQLALVGFTRMKDHYTIYGPIDELFDRSGDAAWAQDRLQVNALEEGLSKKFRGLTTTQWLREEAQKSQAQPESTREKPERRHEGTRAGLFQDSKFLKAAGEAYRKLRDRQQAKKQDQERDAQRERKRDRGHERS